jgi:hypothetical protein
MAITRIGNIASTIPDDSIQNVKFSNIVQSKNIIINGDMSIAQRGTSSSSNTTGGYVTCDRWLADIDTQGTWTLSQSTDVPTGQGFANSFKYDCTTADASPAAGDKINLQQRLEGQMLQYLKKGTSSAESTTLSFWVKSNKTGTYICELQDLDNTRQISKSYTISSANTWEKKTITFAGDTTGAFGNDNARSLDVIWYLGAGSNLTSGTLNTSWNSVTAANRAVGQVNLADSTSNEWYVTGVQLEAGTTASEFEFLPVDVNLQRCQRYYYKRLSENAYGPGSQGMQIGSSNVMIQGYHPVVMRSAPSMSGSNWSIEYSGSSAAWSMGSTRTSTTAWSSENSLSGTDGNAAILYANNNTAADITGDSEL